MVADELELGKSLAQERGLLRPDFLCAEHVEVEFPYERHQIGATLLPGVLRADVTGCEPDVVRADAEPAAGLHLDDDGNDRPLSVRRRAKRDSLPRLLGN